MFVLLQYGFCHDRQSDDKIFEKKMIRSKVFSVRVLYKPVVVKWTKEAIIKKIDETLSIKRPSVCIKFSVHWIYLMRQVLSQGAIKRKISATFDTA